MKERELSPSDKSRKTKLSKKSVEELVGIILRKDDTERKLNKTIDTFKKLQVTDEKRIETLKDYINKSDEIQTTQDKTIAALNATIDNKNKSIETLEEHNKALYGRIEVLEKTIRDRNKETCVLFVILACLVVSNIISIFI